MGCPAPLKGFTPRAVQSPSALRADAECRAQWGYSNLQGRRLEVPRYEDLPPAPPPAPKGASAVEKKRATLALKAYNKPMRMALGTAVHAVFEAYYLQKVAGAWHPPLAQIDLAPLWHTRPGQIALSGRAHMPAPETLAEARCEQFVSVGPVPGWPVAKPWPNLGGTPDLVTLEIRVEPRGLGGGYDEIEEVRYWNLYDYKTTVDFQYAKTASELLDDEQAVLYSLAVMQEHGLSELACTWLYMKTKGAVAAIVPVHFTMTRAHAEARALELAHQAAELAAITTEYISAPRGFLGDEKRLRVLASLPTNDGHCPNYGGCAFHRKAGGPCKPAKSPLGTAMAYSAKQKKKLEGRKQAARALKEKGRDIMAMTTDQSARLAQLLAMPAAGEGKRSFKDNQEMIKLKKLAEAEGASEPAGKADVEATGEEAPAQAASEPAPAKPAAPAKAPKLPDTRDGSAGVYFDATRVEIPKTSPLYKSIVKVCKAQEALASALAGE